PSAMPAGKPDASPIPVRYQDIGKSKLTQLAEGWGAPEQEPALGHGAAVSADGKRAVFATSASVDSYLSLWGTAKGTMIQEWRVAKCAVSALAMTGDGRRVLLALAEFDDKEKDKQPSKFTPRLSLRDLDSGKEVKKLPAKGLAVAVALSPDGKRA